METRISLHAACRTLGLALRAALAWVLPRLCAAAVRVSQSAGQDRRTLTPWVLAHVLDKKKSRVNLAASPYYNHFSKEYGGMIVVRF